ncbi:MAG: hypothetical protein ACI35W_07985 [Anaeroplasmataceae bacterium]
MKMVFTSKRSIAILVFIAFGLLYAIAPSNVTYKVTLKLVGCFLTLDGIIKLIFADYDSMGKVEYRFDVIEGFITIIIGVISFKFYNYQYVTLACGIIYSIVPITRVIMAKRKTNQLLVDCLKYLAIIVLISSINHTLMSNIVISAIFFMIAILIFITLIRKIIKSKKIEEKEEEDYE